MTDTTTPPGPRADARAATPGTTEVEHEITVDAPADAIYRLIERVADWPALFPPTVHAEQVERTGDTEVIRIWATAGGALKTWTSRRELDPVARRIRFRQEVSVPPVAAMGGTWLIEPAGSGSSRVRLLHDYRAIDDDPAGLAWIDEAVDRNSRAELDALKRNVELLTDDTTPRAITFEDTVTVAGAAATVYDFLNEAGAWTQRLPHVVRVALTEDVPGLQTLEMDTRTTDGTTHTTKSFRVCQRPDQIVYKQVTLPALMSLHTGSWTIDGPAEGPLTVTSRHTVIIEEANIERVLGAGADLARAQDFVRTALSANSSATLGLARDHAEGGR